MQTTVMNVHSDFCNWDEQKQNETTRIICRYKNGSYVYIRSDKENFNVNEFTWNEIKIIFNCVNLINLFEDKTLCVLWTQRRDKHIQWHLKKLFFLIFISLKYFASNLCWVIFYKFNTWTSINIMWTFLKIQRGGKAYVCYMTEIQWKFTGPTPDWLKCQWIHLGPWYKQTTSFHPKSCWKCFKSKFAIVSGIPQEKKWQLATCRWLRIKPVELVMVLLQ